MPLQDVSVPGNTVSDSIIEDLWFCDDGETFDPSSTPVQSLAASLARHVGLRPFPAVARRVLEVLGTPSFNLQEVAALIEGDVSLASRVLKLANSALYRGARPVSSVREAFLRLGATTVRECVVAVATMELFHDVGGTGLIFRDHCASTGALARGLAAAWRPDARADLFIAGLLHDVGKLFLIQSGEFNYARFPPSRLRSPEAVHVAEREALGFDHAVLGAHVLLDWEIPEPAATLVAWHHQPERSNGDARTLEMLHLLRLADHLEHLLTSGLDPAEVVEQCGDFGVLEPLGRSKAELASILPAVVDARDQTLAVLSG